jgi:F-type H+-transporting ATPase subunit b
MFNFDATMPLMALQFLLLAFVLNKIFFQPLSKVLDERAAYVRENQQDARERIAKAEQLTQEYEQQLAEARKQSQSILATAQADAQKIAAEKIALAQQAAQKRKEQAALEIEQQKQAAFASLERQVDALSRQILEKVLGAEFVK